MATAVKIRESQAAAKRMTRMEISRCQLGIIFKLLAKFPLVHLKAKEDHVPPSYPRRSHLCQGFE